MVLDGVCYPVVYLCWVILSRLVEPSCSQYFRVLFDEYLVPVRWSTGVYRCLCLPFNGTLSMIRSINHFFKTLDLPSGKGALIH